MARYDRGYLEPKIDIREPHEPGARLGEECNRLMEESYSDWVLIKDTDVLILHPNFYRVCQESIRKEPETGIFTAWCDNIMSKHQRHPGAPQNGTIEDHQRFARKVWDENGFRLDLIEGPKVIGGFFMLINKDAWREADGFSAHGGLFEEDDEFCRRIWRVGRGIRRISGIYCLHLHDRVFGSFLPDEKCSKELWIEHKKRKKKR